jgi:hypothetical protein
MFWIVTVIILFLGGVLGAANLIVAKRPDAKAQIDKLTPYQGVIGVVLLLWGIWDIIGVLRSLGVVSAVPVWWLIYLITALTELGLGFLLGYALISKYALSKSPEATAKGEMLRLKLAAYQGPLGVVAIVLAILFTVFTLMR